MPLLNAEIRAILSNGGLVRFPSTVPGGTGLITDGIVDQIVDRNFSRVTLTASVEDNTITMTRGASDSTTTNGVNIFTVDAKATVGSTNAPGYIYTGDFSGCVFYLYQGPGTEVIGVHAYNGSQPMTRRVGIFRRKVITQVVREFGPVDYFNRNPARMICRYPTRGQMDVSTGENSLSFLSCVDTTTATTFLFSVQGTAQGARVKRLLQTYHVRY
jgi:hypothetical protein